MVRLRAHEREKLTRYALGGLEGQERESLEQHIHSCAPCQEFLTFLQEFNYGLREAKPQGPLPGEPCPDPVLLDALQDEKLDNETAQHVRVHMLYCENCREDYQALDRSRPKIIDVVLGVAGSLIEVLRPPETGVWESPLAIVPVRGEMVPSAPFRMTQPLTDEEDNRSKVTVQVDAGFEPDHVRVLVEGETVQPRWQWRVSLVDGREEEWVGMPFNKSQIFLTSSIPFGFYTLTVRKGENNLGAFKFTVENITLDETLKMVPEYVENRDYFRAKAILHDALSRDPENENLLDELHQVEELIEEEEQGTQVESEDDAEGPQ